MGRGLGLVGELVFEEGAVGLVAAAPVRGAGPALLVHHALGAPRLLPVPLDLDVRVQELAAVVVRRVPRAHVLGREQPQAPEARQAVLPGALVAVGDLDDSFVRSFVR